MSKSLRKYGLILSLCLLTVAAQAASQRPRPWQGQAAPGVFQLWLQEQFQADSVWVGGVDSNSIAVLQQNDSVRFFVVSSEWAPIKGYIGLTSVGLLLDTAGHIEQAEILNSDDSPRYVQKIKNSSFLQQFGKMNPKQIRSVDAVSGATITCRAIESSVQQTLRKLAPLFERVSAASGSYQEIKRLLIQNQ